MSDFRPGFGLAALFAPMVIAFLIVLAQTGNRGLYQYLRCNVKKQPMHISTQDQLW